MLRAPSILIASLLLAATFALSQQVPNQQSQPWARPVQPQESTLPPADQSQQQYPADSQQPSQNPSQDVQNAPLDTQNASPDAQNAPDSQAQQQDQQPAQEATQPDEVPPPLEPPSAQPALPTLPARADAVLRRPAAPNEVPVGYTFLITLDEPLDSATVARGKHFRALVREPLIAPNGEKLTGGHWVTGHVSEVQRGFHAMLLLSFDEIQTPAGWVPLSATVVEIPSEHGLKTPGSEGEIQRKPIDMRRAMEGAGAGAVVGVSASEAAGADSRGIALGAATGAATGAGVASLMDRNVLLDRGAQLVLRLDRGVYLP